MSDTRRLFFALWPPRSAAAALRDCESRVREHCQGRYVPAPNRHLTLAFLGAVGVSDLMQITGAAGKVRARAFTLSIASLQLWRRARILALAPDPVPDALIGLHTALWSALEPCGLRRERRAYRPHVTLARDARCRPELPQLSAFEWPVDAFTLTESVAGCGAPEYVQLARFPLSPD